MEDILEVVTGIEKETLDDRKAFYLMCLTILGICHTLTQLDAGKSIILAISLILVVACYFLPPRGGGHHTFFF